LRSQSPSAARDLAREKLLRSDRALRSDVDQLARIPEDHLGVTGAIYLARDRPQLLPDCASRREFRDE